MSVWSSQRSGKLLGLPYYNVQWILNIPDPDRSKYHSAKVNIDLEYEMCFFFS